LLNLEGTIDDMMNMMHAHPTVVGKRWEMRFAEREGIADINV